MSLTKFNFSNTKELVMIIGNGTEELEQGVVITTL